MKLTRVANAHDCYRHATVKLTRTDSNNITCNEAMTNRSEEITNETTWTSDRTIVCLGVEDLEKHDELSPNHPHLFCINRTNDDANDIRPIKDTHEIY